jgi:hypothetical protein
MSVTSLYNVQTFFLLAGRNNGEMFQIIRTFLKEEKINLNININTKYISYDNVKERKNKKVLNKNK